MSSKALVTQSTTLADAGMYPVQGRIRTLSTPSALFPLLWVLQYMRGPDRASGFDLIQSTRHSVHHPKRGWRLLLRQDSNPQPSDLQTITSLTGPWLFVCLFGGSHPKRLDTQSTILREAAGYLPNEEFKTRNLLTPRLVP